LPADVNLASLIYQEALAQNVPPSIALAVAQKESGISQWTPNGNLVTGTSGEVGVFQIMPATAAGLNVDPSDVSQNITGGVSLLAQLYAKYGNWPQALSAYNSGTPNGSPAYATSVLGLAGNLGATSPALPDPSSDTSDTSYTFGIDPNVLIIGGLVAAAGLIWWLD
jgi:soluble lytic murein transglycosylase-like protein